MEEAAEGKLGAGGESSLPFTTRLGPMVSAWKGLRFHYPGAEVQIPGVTVTGAPCLSNILPFPNVVNVTFIAFM